MKYPPYNSNYRRKRIRRERLSMIFNKQQIEHYYRIQLNKASWSHILSTVFNSIRIMEQTNQSICNQDLFDLMHENIIAFLKRT